MGRIDLQDSLELGNGFGGLAALGEEAAEIVARTHKVGINFDRCIEVGERFVFSPVPIEDYAKHVMSDCGVWRSLNGHARRTFSIRKGICLESRNRTIQGSLGGRAQSGRDRLPWLPITIWRPP